MFSILGVHSSERIRHPVSTGTANVTRPQWILILQHPPRRLRTAFPPARENLPWKSYSREPEWLASSTSVHFTSDVCMAARLYHSGLLFKSQGELPQGPEKPVIKWLGMTTAIVTGTGRRSSIRQSDLQPPATDFISQSMTTSPIDKFPQFKDDLYEIAAGPRESHSNFATKYTPNDRWEPRKENNFASEYTNGTIRHSKHKPRKSISEAISTIRTRNASVSANAQELAQALRAPVSYKLIVWWTVLAPRQESWLTSA